MYVKKTEVKGRTLHELDRILCWLTGYMPAGLREPLQSDNDLEAFYAQAPAFHPNAALITSMVRVIRGEDIEHPLMRKIRYLDKLVYELTKDKAVEKILHG